MSHSAVNGHITETNIKEFCDHDPILQLYAKQLRALGLGVTPARVGPGAAEWSRERVAICHRLKRFEIEELRELLESRPMPPNVLYERIVAGSKAMPSDIDSDGLLFTLLQYAVFG